MNIELENIFNLEAHKTSTAKERCEARKFCEKIGIPAPDWAIRRNICNRFALQHGRNSYTCTVVFAELALWGGKEEHERYWQNALKAARDLGDSPLVWYIEQKDLKNAMEQLKKIIQEINPTWGTNPSKKKKPHKKVTNAKRQERQKELNRRNYIRYRDNWRKIKAEMKEAKIPTPEPFMDLYGAPTKRTAGNTSMPTTSNAATSSVSRDGCDTQPTKNTSAVK